MFTQLWDKDALERSMNKSVDREHDGFDHIRNNMNTALDMISATAKGVGKISDVAMDIQDARDKFTSATSRQQRTQTEAGLSMERGKPPKIQNVSQQTPLGHSMLSAVQTGIGSGGTQVIGNSTAPPIQLKLGKQLGTNNSIANFLSLMHGSGSASVAFGGRLRCRQDERVRTYNAYRHNLHDGNYGFVGGPYPGGSYIMNPSGSVFAQLQGAYNGNVQLANSHIRDINNTNLYFSFYNKADLEDLSWNLNKFKLGPVTDLGSVGLAAPAGTVAGGNPKIQLLDDVQALQVDSHRGLSALWQNNTRQYQLPNTAGQTYTTAPFMYDAVLKQGTVDYLFMNKGESPCEVELVVYRVKKTGVQGVPYNFSELALTTQLERPICEGMMRKTLGAVSTDLCPPGAHVPSSPDWVSNPARPFLPKNRFIDQASTPYTEVNRVKLCLQSGQRRPFQIKLGGVQYDPSKAVLTKLPNSSPPQGIPIFDEHSYIVCIALNGIAMSRQLGGESVDNKLTTGPIIGDCYASADLQWYSNYTENVGAMSYKKVQSRNLFSYGAAPEMRQSLSTYNNAAAPGQKINSTPVALLSQGQAVRIPDTPVQTVDSTGAYSISTQATQSAQGGATETP
jgi:hypothetical protein